VRGAAAGLDVCVDVGLGATGFAFVVVRLEGVVGVVALVVADPGVLVGVTEVVEAARGVWAAPAQALSARQAAANQTVCRMVTEGSPAPPPPALRPAGFEANTPSRTDESVSNRR
jgi:hypothetical protein